MTDVFDALVGQDSAVAAMRQYVKAPVHAYLMSGPVGSSLHDTVLTFAAALQCPENGCGACEICRLVLSDADADVYFAERAGLSWRILGRDDELAQRIAQWRSVPDRLNGTPATSAALATEIARALNDAIAPLQQIQDEEMELRVREARQMGQRSISNRRDTEAQFKREQRRFRIDELRFGLTALTNVYRDRMVESLEGSELGEARDQYRVGASIRAIGVLSEATRRLSSNVDETLLLNDLMLSLMEF